VEITVETMDVSELKPHPLNLVLYGVQEPDKDLVSSIKDVGVLEPLVYSFMSPESDGATENYILSGHRRWAADRVFVWNQWFAWS
jgi:ParB-like chromosome segregation protein Spo0J